MDNYQKFALIGVVCLTLVTAVFAWTPLHRSRYGLASFVVAVLLIAITLIGLALYWHHPNRATSP